MTIQQNTPNYVDADAYLNCSINIFTGLSKKLYAPPHNGTVLNVDYFI